MAQEIQGSSQERYDHHAVPGPISRPPAGYSQGGQVGDDSLACGGRNKLWAVQAHGSPCIRRPQWRQSDRQDGRPFAQFHAHADTWHSIRYRIAPCGQCD
eukprot:scaffold135921_cov31-Tisochrysis_lutea.AAC.2